RAGRGGAGGRGRRDHGGGAARPFRRRGRTSPRGDALMDMKRIGIVVGGGPAPGPNAVLTAAVIEAVKHGRVPLGFQDGFHWLAQRYTDEQREMTIDEVSHA